MLPGIPGTPEMKSELVEYLRSNCNPLFTNHVVHMLMVAFTIFSGDDIDKNVRDVHAVAESMLRTHLSSEEEVVIVLRCLSILPRMVDLKQRMMKELMKQMQYMQQLQRNPN